jgi:hypothetical protein
MSVQQSDDSRAPAASGVRPRLSIVLEIEASPTVVCGSMSDAERRRLVDWLLSSGLWDQLVGPAVEFGRWEPL